VQERDELSFRSHSRLVVYQGYSGGATSFERGFEIVELEADVMYGGTAPRDEFPDWRIVVNRLEQLDERTARIETADSGSVHRRKLLSFHAKDVPVKGKHITNRADRNADVSNSNALGG
jgi:hypothetical protein